MTEFVQFPAGFKWGAATAAYQIEGAVHEDGRTDSIWDVFAHTPGKVANGDTGDVACGHYHRWKDDVALLKELGIPAYRFSISWPRILPQGHGKVNQAGIDFYSRLVDELLNAGIMPMVTLYHWDIPAAVPGAWLNRDAANYFAELTSACAAALGDRVKDWITINEPYCASFTSYKYCAHAPGIADPTLGVLPAHHLLLAHGLAVPVLRQLVSSSRVGIALNFNPYYTPTRSDANLTAVRHADGEFNRWFLDPVYGRGYPSDILADYVKMGTLSSINPDFIHPGDMERIGAPIDFLAVNYYSRTVISAGKNIQTNPEDVVHHPAPREIQTEMGWEIFPHGLYEVLSRIQWDYKPGEIIITENGASYSDGPDSSGRVRDERRIAYLQSHLAAVARAIESGVPVTGYYQWSLLDNFEWSFGYSQRFGIVHMDFASQKRTPKDSAYWYRQVIQQNGLTLD